ncbi:MAG: tetratricopeptide repeat protein [Candidatus Electrothrix sp. AX2]|nr:tetratricopeptide repeat protein [Candidatus Electrothrix gigas]
MGRDKIIKQYLLGSVDYKELVQEIKDAQELLAGIAPDKTALRLKQSAKVEELKQRLEDFKENVFRLHEIFTRIPIDNERLRKAKAHFDRGEFREADAVLKAEEIQEDVKRLKLEEQAAEGRLAAVRKGLEDRANEYLLKAKLSLINPVAEGEDRFTRTEQWFEQALATARTAEALYEYAYFLSKHNIFSRAEPLYKEVLAQYRSEADPEAVVTTLNNLAVLHSKTGEYGPALQEYEEALKLYRRLAADQPEAFLPDVAGALNNLANLYKDTSEYGPALKEYKESLKM